MVATPELCIDLNCVFNFLRSSDALDNRVVKSASEVNALCKKTLNELMDERSFETLHGVAEHANNHTTIDTLARNYRRLKDAGFEFTQSESENLARKMIQDDDKTWDHIPHHHPLALVFNDLIQHGWGNNQLFRDAIPYLMGVKQGTTCHLDTIIDTMMAIEDDRLTAEAFEDFSKLYGFESRRTRKRIDLGVFADVIRKIKSKEIQGSVVEKVVEQLGDAHVDGKPEEHIVWDTKLKDFMAFTESLGYPNLYDDLASRLYREEEWDKAARMYSLMHLLHPEEPGYTEKASNIIDICLDIDSKKKLDALKSFGPDVFDFVSKESLLASLDEAVKRHYTEDYYMDRDIERLYGVCGLSMHDAWDREARIFLEQGSFDLALKTYSLINSKQKAFDVAVEMAKAGQIKDAFSVFTGRKLGDDVDIDNSYFYKTIASSILSLFVPKDLEPDVETLRNAYDSIRPGLIKGIHVSREDGLNLALDFGKYKLSYSNQKLRGYRNDVNILLQRSKSPGVSEQKSVLKVYEDRHLAETEAFLLKLFQGRIPAMKLIHSGMLGDTAFNQIDICNGKIFYEAADQQAFRDAIDITLNIYDLIKTDEQRVGEVVNRQLTDDYLVQRFEEFYERFEELGMGSDVTGALREMQGAVSSVLKANVTGIIPSDYTPRNLMIVRGNVVTIDHEDYMYGNPITPPVTLVSNPENGLRRDQSQELIQYARDRLSERGIYTPQPLVGASNLFYDVRRARTLARDYLEGKADENTLPHINWFLDDMREVMGI